MAVYKAKVCAYFDIIIDDSADIETVTEYIEMSKIQELIEFESDYEDSIQYIKVKEIKKIQ